MMLKKKVKDLKEYYYQWMCKHKDDADRRLALLMRVNEWANETGQCPICRSVSWDGDALMHVPECELDAECNG